MSADQLNCPICKSPIIPATQSEIDESKHGRYFCKGCENSYHHEGARGLCIVPAKGQTWASSGKVIDFLLKVLKEKPTITAKELDHELDIGRISIQSYESAFMEIRREARLFRLGETAGLMLPHQHIPVLVELADLLEKRKKSWMAARTPAHAVREEEDDDK